MGGASERKQTNKSDVPNPVSFVANTTRNSMDDKNRNNLDQAESGQRLSLDFFYFYKSWLNGWNSLGFRLKRAEREFPEPALIHWLTSKLTSAVLSNEIVWLHCDPTAEGFSTSVLWAVAEAAFPLCSFEAVCSSVCVCAQHLIICTGDPGDFIPSLWSGSVWLVTPANTGKTDFKFDSRWTQLNPRANLNVRCGSVSYYHCHRSVRRHTDIWIKSKWTTVCGIGSAASVVRTYTYLQRRMS